MEITNIKNTGYSNYSIVERQTANSSGTGSNAMAGNSVAVYEKSANFESYGLYNAAGVSTQKLSNHYQV